MSAADDARNASDAKGAHSLHRRDMPLALGVETEWGHIGAVGCLSGERYYWIIDRIGGVGMLPADVVEKRHIDQAHPTAAGGAGGAQRKDSK